MVTYTIEKNVPLPANTIEEDRKTFPFEQMEVGDSFLVPAEEEHFNTMKTRVKRIARYLDINIIIRKTRVGAPVNGFRVWRVADGQQQ